MTNADAKTAERYMVLLEQIQSQVQLIAESHGQLDRKIDSVRSELIEFKADVGIFINMMHQRLDGIDMKLDRVCSDVERHGTALRKNRLLQ